MLWAVWHRERPNDARRLAAIGKNLTMALELAAENPVDSVPHAAAWARVDRAIAELGELVGPLDELKPILTVASRRVAGRTKLR